MTDPPKKDPRRRSPRPTLPPVPRSRAALMLDRAAALGRFMLQSCTDCGTVCYPARDACPSCLSDRLRWQDQPRGGTVLAATEVRLSQEPYFRDRAPWRIGLVRSDAGPVIAAHLHPAAEPGGRVRLSALLDRAGRAAILAAPEDATEDPRMAEFTADPAGRRVLVTDATSPAGQALVPALRDAGAALVFAGIPAPWLDLPEAGAWRAADGVQTLTLDLTDETGLAEAAASIGGKVDILINTAAAGRPGNILSRTGVAEARREVEVLQLGLIRLAQAFGPAMMARAADAPARAAAFVNLLPVGALAPEAGWAAQSAAAAGALSATLALRAEMQAAGLRVGIVFHGPLDEAWRAEEPPPKLAPGALARSVIDLLRSGADTAFAGEVARDFAARHDADPHLTLREALEAFRR